MFTKSSQIRNSRKALYLLGSKKGVFGNVFENSSNIYESSLYAAKTEVLQGPFEEEFAIFYAVEPPSLCAGKIGFWQPPFAKNFMNICKLAAKSFAFDEAHIFLLNW